MKRFFVALCAISLIAFDFAAAQVPLDDLPPSATLLAPEPVSPLEADTYFDAVLSRAEALPPTSATAQLSSTTPDEISELSRALRDDVDLIFERVYNTIEVTPTFGLKKSPLGTLLDRSGNPFDQANLLTALLLAAGYDAELVYGDVVLPLDVANDWLGTTGDGFNARSVLAAGYIPVQLVQSGGVVTGIWIKHIWVQVQIGGTFFQFDPSLKRYQKTEGLPNLIDILEYTRIGDCSGGNLDPGCGLLTAAGGQTGSTGPAQLKDVDSAAVQAKLDKYAENLVGYIRAQMPTAELKDVVGGREIVGLVDEQRRVLAHPYLKPDGSRQVWGAEVERRYKTTITIPKAGKSCVLAADQTFRRTTDTTDAKRLSVMSTGSSEAGLFLDGTRTARWPNLNGTLSFEFCVNFPYPTSFSLKPPLQWGGPADYKFSVNLAIAQDYAYSLTNNWGETGQGRLEYHKSRLDQSLSDGDAATSESVIGEALLVTGTNYLLQVSATTELFGNLTGELLIRQGAAGVSGQTTGPYVDFPGLSSSVAVRDGNSDLDTIQLLYASAGPGSALEATTIEQVTDSFGVSTTSFFENRSDTGAWFYDLETEADLDALQAQLLANGYTATNIDQFRETLRGEQTSSDGTVTTWDGRLILPENANVSIGTWSGTAYIEQRVYSNDNRASLAYAINNLKGGNSSVNSPPRQTANMSAKTSQAARWYRAAAKRVGRFVADPVNTFSGSFFHTENDLTVGTDGFPYGLSFERTYQSVDRLSDSDLGRGWTHNLDLRLVEYSDGMQSLGLDSPIDAAAMIVSLAVSTDLLRNETDLKTVLVATLVQDWGSQHLYDNAITVTIPGINLTFVKLPGNLGYNPPPDSSAKLTNSGAFVFETLAGDQLTFTGEKKAATWTNKNGFEARFSYDANDRLNQVTNDFGWVLNLEYGANGRITSINDGAGRIVRYGYAGNGSLASFTNTEGSTTSYSYEAGRPGLMTAIYYPAFPNIPFISNAYDSLGRVQEQTTPQTGAGNPYVYYLAETRAEVVDPLGGSEVWYQDRFGKITKHIDQLGRETVSVFDGRQRSIETVFPEGNRRTAVYDDATCVTRCTNQVTSITAHADPDRGGADLTESYTYWDASKRYGLRTRTDARFNVWNYDYDHNGNLKTIDGPSVAGGAPQTLLSYYGPTDVRRGLLKSRTDPTGLVTEFNVDAARGTLSEVIVDPGNLDLRTQFTYDTWGNLRTTTDPEGRVTTSLFDCERRLRATVPPNPGAGRTPLPTSRTDYDADGRPVVQALVRGDVSGTACGASSGGTGTALQTSRMVYQQNGMLSQEIDPQGAATKYVYDALDRQVTMTDPDGRAVETTYDAAGQIIRTKAVLGTEETVIANIEYSANGNQTALIDALNNRSEFIYDGHDRLIETRYPSKTVPGTTNPADKELLNYDPNGNVTSRTTRAGQTIAYTYDTLNRLTDKTGAVAQDVQYGYDLAGRQTSAVFTSGTSDDITYSFDSAGRLIAVTDQGRMVSYGYDRSGNRTEMTWPDGVAVSYHYDDASRLAAIREGAHAAPSASLASYDYGALSLLASQALGDGGAAGTSTYAYFSDSTLRAVTHDLFGDSDDVRFEMTYWPSNRLRSMTLSNEAYQYQPVAGLSETFTANGLNQLTTASFGGASANLNYDPNGNLTAEGTAATYGYDAENRLTSAQTGGTTVAFGYDPQDRRSTKTVGGTAVTYLYDGAEIIADLAPDGTVLRRYVYGLRVDEPIAMYVGTGSVQKQFYVSDPQGSVIALTDETGAVQERHSYSPFGRPDTAAIGSSGNPLRYASLRWDAVIGLYDMRARVYNPQLRRFLQTDPIGYGDGPNIYAYVGNDPMNLGDPFGLKAEASMQAVSNFAYNSLGVVDPSTGTALVDSNIAATVHYFFGSGEDAVLGPRTVSRLRTHPRQRHAEANLRSGTTIKNSNYGVNLEARMYHVGRTGVSYETSCANGKCTTAFTAFVAMNSDGSVGRDGVRDTLVGDDRKGPSGEAPLASPYDYLPHRWSIEYQDNFAR